jgi:phosphoglycolate phosphatase-like HAD superfamily hydrolase
MRLFLFDVDGTLIYAHGAGRLALTRALEDTYGTAGPADLFDSRGKTDPQIVLELMTAAGIPRAGVQARLGDCFQAYVRHLEALMTTGHPVDVMPGITQVVQTLSSRPDALVGLLTGNIEGGARAKLRPTGLLPYFRVGAFGSDDADRRRLPGVAQERARVLARCDIPFRHMVIIGDTPLDIDCARACGAVAVAVSTGQYRAEELAACSPDLLLYDFSNVTATLLALTRG